MKRFILLLLAVMAVTACGTSRRVALDPADPVERWVGRTTSEILTTMGDPDRIDTDGKDGSILVYESTPDYDSPDYDILDPDANAKLTRRYAKFYLTAKGTCYHVDANRNLPAPRRAYDDDSGEVWVDILIYLPLLLIGILL